MMGTVLCSASLYTQEYGISVARHGFLQPPSPLLLEYATPPNDVDDTRRWARGDQMTSLAVTPPKRDIASGTCLDG